MNRPLNLIRILQIFPTHAMVMLVSSRTKELYDSNLDQRITNLSGLQWILKTPYQELLLVIELVIVGEIFDICYHCVWLNSLQKTEVMNAWSCNFLVNNFQKSSVLVTSPLLLNRRQVFWLVHESWQDVILNHVEFISMIFT